MSPSVVYSFSMCKQVLKILLQDLIMTAVYVEITHINGRLIKHELFNINSSYIAGSCFL